MKKIYKDRLLKLANFLDTLPRKKFDFSQVVTKAEQKNQHICGTVCCAIGWAPTVFPRSWEWVDNGDAWGVGIYCKPKK